MNCRDCRFWSQDIKPALVREGYGLCLEVKERNYLPMAGAYCSKHEKTTAAEIARRRQLVGGRL